MYRQRRTLPPSRLLLAMFVSFSLLYACGGTPSTVVTKLDDVQSAVVQIETQGRFVYREEGEGFYIGNGSGFIIDPSGIVVTNNHVVTGAGQIRVHIGGTKQDPNGVPAEVLGRSECSDIAVLKIQGEGPYRYLDWYADEIKNLLPVIAVGFPSASGKGYDTTRGSISQLNADGQTNWASVSNVIEHDARINPGSSGGPLISEDGKIVGVNYAGQSSAQLSFAIGRDLARPLVDRLKERKNEMYIGVNGEAFQTDDVSGIWVSSVQANSPADKAQIKPGDVITSLGNVLMAQNGTLEEYCGVLASNPEQAMDVEIYRPTTGEILTGQVNSEKALAVVQAPTVVPTEVPPTDVPANPTPQPSADYRKLTSSSGHLTVEVPSDWSNVATDGVWTFDDKEVGVAISANRSSTSFQDWSGPGVFLAASRSLLDEMSIEQLLDRYTFSDECTYDGRYDYSDQIYSGKYDAWTNCTESGAVLYIIVFEPADQSFIGMVQVQLVDEADNDALDRIVQTFTVKGDF